MRVTIRQGKILELVRGDITEANVDAIVNAANAHLAGGGGVDGAIHRAGGSTIANECRLIGGCPTGKAVVTSGGNLKARYVIHAVAPRWRGGQKGEVDLLRSAYESSMQVANEMRAQSVAFPSLGTGIYGNPLEQSAHIALTAITAALEQETTVEEVKFYLFSDGDLTVYERTLRKIAGSLRKMSLDALV